MPAPPPLSRPAPALYFHPFFNDSDFPPTGEVIKIYFPTMYSELKYSGVRVKVE